MKPSSITLTILTLFFSCFAAAQAGPQRMISLAPSITKSIYLLGAQDRLVAVTVYCPPEASSKEKIGTVYEPNIEKIVSLRPDLVIATKEGNTLAPVETLRKLGVKVYIVEHAANFSEICANFIALGKAIGEEVKAREVVASNEQKLALIKERVKNRKKPSVFWQVGTQPIFTASKKSFVNDFIEFAGGTNIFAELGQRYPQVSLEEVIKRDPDVIIMVSMGGITMQEKARWLSFKSLKAARTGRIYMLDDPIFTNPTPQAVADGAEIVEKLLNNP